MDKRSLETRVRANYKTIRTIERKLARFAEAMSNDSDVNQEVIDAKSAEMLARVEKLLQVPQGLIFISWDPRGYQLKTKPEEADDLPTDWGGYGIIGHERDLPYLTARDALRRIGLYASVPEEHASQFIEDVQTVSMYLRIRSQHDG
jgi:hypothetical protein